MTLVERVIDWATRFAFSQTATLLGEFCGTALLSEDTIWRLCQAQADQIEQEQQRAITMVQQQSEQDLPSPQFVAPTTLAPDALYDPASQEFVVLTDAIGVPSQKPTRQRAGQERKSKEAKRHDTDVFVLPRQDGGEQFVCEGLRETYSCVSAVGAFLRQEWSGCALAVVAITDGATKIRSDLGQIFGERVRVILDWYHLAKRVRENLSMIACGKEQREEWEEHLLPLLWNGQVDAARAFVAELSARRELAKAALLGYLDKHASEIIDYGRRQDAGKPIGSGRMEKAVDQVIGQRQKNRGMSWTKEGSRALAMLTVAKLNARDALSTLNALKDPSRSALCSSTA